MNPNNIRQPNDRRKIYNEYLANLQMQIDNLAKTEGAVTILNTTGAAPVQPPDTRTVSEKLLDVDKQKQVLKQALLEITDGAEAGKIMKEISDEDVVFLGVAWGDFSKMVKQKFAAGILAPLFKEVLQRYKRDYINSLSVQQGISSGHTTEELLLSMRELMRLMPNAEQLRELNFTIQNLPAGTVPPSMKSTALTAVSNLDSLLLTQDDIDSLDKMNAIDKAAAEKAFNDGFSSVASAANIQYLTNQLQQAKPREIPDILSKIIGDILLTRDDAALAEQAKAIAAAEEAIYQAKAPGILSAQKAEVSKKKSGVAAELKQRRAAAEQVEAFGSLPPEEAAATVTKTKKQAAVTNFDDVIEDAAIPLEDIESLPLGVLRAWASSKVRAEELPKITGISKLPKNELLNLVQQWRALSVSAPSQKAAAPAQKAVLTPAQKEVRKAIKQGLKQGTTIFVEKEYSPSMLLDDFENRAITDYADKRTILEDMDKTGLLETYLTKDEYDDFKETMAQNKMKDEPKLVQFFKKVHLGMGGKGVKGKKGKITFGCGLAPTLMVKPNNIDFEKGLKKEAAYIPIGKYVINKHKLRDNMLLMRTVKGGQIAELPQMSISSKLSKMLNKIINGHGFPSHNDLTEMEDSDKDIMYKVFKMSKAEGIDAIPRPNKTKDEQEFNRFTILKGQILSGNNSKELIKEFKTLLVKLIHADKILRKDGHAILLDLAALGF